MSERTPLEVLKSLLDERGWIHGPLTGDLEGIQLQIGGKNGRWTAVAAEAGEGEALLFYSVLPLRCPEPNRARLAAWLMRINSELVTGSVDLDMDNGEIRVRTSQLLRGVDFTPIMCAHLMESNLLITDAHIEEILRQALAGSAPPAAA